MERKRETENSGFLPKQGNFGEHLCTNPPYGYMKDPTDKKKWIVDEEAAEVVGRIFALCVAGKGSMQIAKVLTADKVLTVKAYQAKQNGKGCSLDCCIVPIVEASYILLRARTCPRNRTVTAAPSTRAIRAIALCTLSARKP